MSGNEIQIFTELVKEKKDILECKKTNDVSYKMKKKAWKEIN
jgi:hypothetical protein